MKINYFICNRVEMVWKALKKTLDFFHGYTPSGSFSSVTLHETCEFLSITTYIFNNLTTSMIQFQK